MRNLTRKSPSPRPLSRSSRRRAGWRKSVLAASLAICPVLLVPSAAQAVTVDTDRPRITGQNVDFGLNWVLNAPASGGYLTWSLANGAVTPLLRGRVYINNAPGTCARMQMQYFNAADRRLATRNSGLYCAADGSRHDWYFTLSSYSGPSVVKVKVLLQTRNTSGSYSTVGSVVETLD